MKLYYNSYRQNAKVASYPHYIEIKDCDDLRTAASHDHVCALYKDNCRKNSNFLLADCTMFDIDNTHSENPAEWIDTEFVKKAFPNVPFYVCFSRNHMKEKNGKTPRPKFHVYFPDEEITDPIVYSDLKHMVADYFSYFDQNAKDNARFFFGVENPSVDYIEGTQPLSEFMKIVTIPESKKENTQSLPAPQYPQPLRTAQTANSDSAPIPVGERNTTLYKYAGKVLKRYGDAEIARQKFMERVSYCEERLDNAEVEQIWSSAKKHFHTVTEKDPQYVPPDQFSGRSSNENYKPSDYSDVGQAEAFFQKFGDRVRYSTKTGYLVFIGNRWIEDDLRAHGLVQKFTDLQLAESKDLLMNAQNQVIAAEEEGDAAEKTQAKTSCKAADRYWKFALRTRATERVSAILKEIRPKIQISPSKLDANRYLLNTPAGTIDLHTGQMRPHDPSDYCTKITGVAPSSEGNQLFKDFLDTITCKDVELERYLQQVAGMCAIGQVKCEHMIIAYGRGKNGKSTFFNLLARVLGSYSGSLSAEVLTAKNTKNKGPELAELRGKRLVISSELEEGTMLNSAMVKNLCSTDIIKGEQKYKAPIEFSASHTLILHTNHLPQVRADDDGTWRRLVVVPFDAVISEKAEKKDFTETLYAEAGGSVLKWIIDGAKDFIENEYQVKMPIRVKEAIAEYRAENDWLGCFLSACCEIGAQYKVPSGDLYKRYQDYCKTEDERAHSHQIFNSALEQRGFCAKRTNSTRYRTGLRLKEEIGGLPPYEFLHEQNVAKAENSDEGDDEIVEF